MAKISKIAKTLRWNARILRSAENRSQKRKLLNQGDFANTFYLSKTRSRSVVRLKNRCQITGRPRGYIGDFGMSRNLVRDLSALGCLPGVKKI